MLRLLTVERTFDNVCQPEDYNYRLLATPLLRAGRYTTQGPPRCSCRSSVTYSFSITPASHVHVFRSESCVNDNKQRVRGRFVLDAPATCVETCKCAAASRCEEADVIRFSLGLFAFFFLLLYFSLRCTVPTGLQCKSVTSHGPTVCHEYTIVRSVRSNPHAVSDSPL